MAAPHVRPRETADACVFMRVCKRTTGRVCPALRRNNTAPWLVDASHRSAKREDALSPSSAAGRRSPWKSSCVPPKTKTQSAPSAAAAAGKTRPGGGTTSAKAVQRSPARSRRYRSVLTDDEKSGVSRHRQLHPTVPHRCYTASVLQCAIMRSLLGPLSPTLARGSGSCRLRKLRGLC